MKKHNKLIMALVLFISMAFSFVNGQSKSELEKLDDFLKLEADTLEAAINKDVNLKAEFTTINAYNAIKLYSFKEHDYFVDFNQIKSFAELISDEFVYAIPTMGNHTVLVKEENDKFEMLGVVGPSPNVENSDIKLATIKNDLAQSKLDVKTSDIVYVQSHKYYLNLAYFTTSNDEEYVIPYAARPEFLGIKNGVPLKAKEFLEISEKHFSDQVEHTDAGIISKLKYNSLELMIVSIGVVVIGFLIVLYRKGNIFLRT